MTASPDQSVTRLDDAGMLALVGEDVFKRFKNKQRGGQNGFKGVRYEYLFLAHRTARMIRKLIETGADATIEWQSYGFVDDVVVRRDSQKSFKGYQLKNSAGADWTVDIEDDFKHQYVVCGHEAYDDIRLRLVCSDQDTAANLAANVPGEIACYSEAIFFPYTAEAIIPLLKEREWLKEDFAYLSKHEHPSTADVDQVASVVMGACGSLGQSFTASEIVNKARRMSPTLLRALKSDEEAEALLTPDFREVLASWTDFTYRISRGFLCWTAFGETMEGSLSMDCFDPKFAAWQQNIIQQRPRAFQDVEGLFV